MDTAHDEGEARPGDLLVGRDEIHDFLVLLGMPDSLDPYYLKRSGWPIGNTAGSGGKLIASRRRLAKHTERLARGSSAA